VTSAKNASYCTWLTITIVVPTMKRTTTKTAPATAAIRAPAPAATPVLNGTRAYGARVAAERRAGEQDENSRRDDSRGNELVGEDGRVPGGARDPERLGILDDVALGNP
jgi:hypothetical protein